MPKKIRNFDENLNNLTLKRTENKLNSNPKNILSSIAIINSSSKKENQENLILKNFQIERNLKSPSPNSSSQKLSKINETYFENTFGKTSGSLSKPTLKSSLSSQPEIPDKPNKKSVQKRLFENSGDKNHTTESYLMTSEEVYSQVFLKGGSSVKERDSQEIPKDEIFGEDEKTQFALQEDSQADFRSPRQEEEEESTMKKQSVISNLDLEDIEEDIGDSQIRNSSHFGLLESAKKQPKVLPESVVEMSRGPQFDNNQLEISQIQTENGNEDDLSLKEQRLTFGNDEKKMNNLKDSEIRLSYGKMETGSSGKNSHVEDPNIPQNNHKLSVKESNIVPSEKDKEKNKKTVTIVDKKIPKIFAFKKKIEQLFSFNIPFQSRKNNI